MHGQTKIKFIAVLLTHNRGQNMKEINYRQRGVFPKTGYILVLMSVTQHHCLCWYAYPSSFIYCMFDGSVSNSASKHF